MTRYLCLVFCLLLAAGARAGDPERIVAGAKHAAVAAQLEALITAEMEGKHLPAVSIALVDGEDIAWAQGFGAADPDGKVAATASTIHRVGSVSKLFTDLAVMQLVERGTLDLDAPVTRYLPDFAPHNPFGKEITLRQLMSHRAGLVREPPVGNYFDSTSPSLAATVASLNETELVLEPGASTKYSNAGIAVVGRVLERALEQPFAQCLQTRVLDPLGLANSSFEPRVELRARLAKAFMWTYDGRTFAAPTFELGMAPAGSMYTSVLDLARFVRALMNGSGPVQSHTLAQMWTPQFGDRTKAAGFGLGFHLGMLEGHRQVGHSGAIYGFSTALEMLPDDKLGVAAVITLDCTNAVANHIADHALRALLAAREGRALPELPSIAAVPAATADALAGRYRSGEQVIDLAYRGGRLMLLDGEMRAELRATRDVLVIDDRLRWGPLVETEDGGLDLGGKSYRRAAAFEPQPAPARFKGLIGEYGWDHDTLYVLEHDGVLHALIEWFYEYPLREIGDGMFQFPDHGLYAGEKVVFTRDARGEATQVVAACVRFPRRRVGTADGETFRIQPLLSMEELRRAAAAAQPPAESGKRAPELVELVSLSPTIKLDIRYATTNNFMSAQFYSQARAFLQRPAADALLRAHESLRPLGYGLLIHDAYRPWAVTKMFFDATPADKKIFVADPAQGSRHNRGCAVDLSLYDLKTGAPVQMVGGYDEMSERSYPDYPGGTSRQRWLRDTLRDAMEAQGFTVYEFEWWHFDYRDWREYPILNVPFEQIR